MADVPFPFPPAQPTIWRARLEDVDRDRWERAASPERQDKAGADPADLSARTIAQLARLLRVLTRQAPDYRTLPRLFQVKESVVTVGTSAVTVAKPDSRRVTLMLGTAGPSVVFSTLRQVTTTAGFPSASTAGPVVIDYARFGPAPGYEWFGIASAGTPAVAVLEVIDPGR